MDKKKIMDVALVPTVVLLVLQLISFVTLLIPRFNLYSSSDFSVLPLLGVIFYLLPAIIYIYAGYSAVKNYKLELGEAFSIGVMMSALMTLTSTLITSEMMAYQGRTERSYYIYALIGMIFGLVGGSLFNGFLAFVGGAVAQPKPKPETAQAEKKSTDWVVIGALVIVVILVIVFVLFYLGPTPSPRYISQCTFPAGFTCITTKLQVGTSKLYLIVGQGTGHSIMVTGLNCTQNTSSDFSSSGTISYGPNQNITIASGSSATLSTPSDASKTWLNVTCVLANGSDPLDTNIGSLYNGKIYIKYTETDTDLQRIVVGTYTAKYES
jgi:MFS family permease